MARRKHSGEYKKEALALTQVTGATMMAVAADFGISAHMLGKWRKAMEQHGETAFPGQCHARDEEMMQLKRELVRVRKERDLLRDAAAFYAKEQK